MWQRLFVFDKHDSANLVCRYDLRALLESKMPVLQHTAGTQLNGRHQAPNLISHTDWVAFLPLGYEQSN